MRIETDIGWHRRKKRMLFRRSLEERFQEVIPTASLVPPFVITGPFVVEGFLDQLMGLNPLPVYTSSWYTEAPTVVNTQDAWNVIRTQTVNFPLFWNRMY